MKVFHCCNSFSGLSETFIYDYIIELDRKRIENYVLTFTRINEIERPFYNVILIKPKKDFMWFILRFISILNCTPGKYFRIQRREIKKHITKIKPDIIHAHFGPMGVLVSPFAKKFGIPLVVSFHGYDASLLLKDKFWIQSFLSLNDFSSFITAVSNNMKERLRTIIKNEKIYVIHVGKKLEYYPFKLRSNKIKNFLAVGRIIEKKGYLDLIEAFSLVIEYYPDISLNIIGDGPLREDLRNLIYHKGIQKNVKLLGELNHNDVINYFHESDAFILTSKTAKDGDMEGIPTVLMEAQALGLPVISTKHSGIPECIPKENHKFLAEEGNVEQIRDCIIKLIETDKEELEEIVKRGRKKIEEDFNLEKEVKKLIHIYNEGLSNAK